MSAAPTKTELVDLFWRSIWTFIAAFTSGTAVNTLGDWNIDAVQLAAIAGGGAVVTLIKAYSSNKLLGTGTASDKSSAVLGLPQPVASNNATPVGS